jgi:hypothetical protein
VCTSPCLSAEACVRRATCSLLPSKQQAEQCELPEAPRSSHGEHSQYGCSNPPLRLHLGAQPRAIYEAKPQAGKAAAGVDELRNGAVVRPAPSLSRRVRGSSPYGPRAIDRHLLPRRRTVLVHARMRQHQAHGSKLSANASRMPRRVDARQPHATGCCVSGRQLNAQRDGGPS